MASIEKIKELLSTTDTVLELVQLADGELALRAAGDDDKEPLLTIKFSDKVQNALGDNAPLLGQHMIQSALFALMEQQAARWHAQVMDEEPAHFS
jgi:hypothetical protein